MRSSLSMPKAAAVAACASLLPLVAAPTAFAEDALGGKQEGFSVRAIDSYLSGVRPGFESSMTDIASAPTIIDFYNCRTPDHGYVDESTSVQLINFNYTSPNEYWDTKTFTACFDGGQSHGEWTGKKGDDLFFKIKSVNGSTNGAGSGPTLSVTRVHMW
ncbi:hypothetical protein [Streptomyces poonensis]|uniref:Uncharacterized protein n=1 Tax=Streptomyces poonensis TaxID=68255 RepID=A0A918PMC9_9ACTN|nr:hypothetical protein [Streptomyces poonensis]GGZ15488.1 hypothetical protein GCM10010365_39070 [Streptomyces poonensis]GLJ91510.1 hypothetical protein GCM10017589_41170 [Streptomyces poonensis]